MSKQRELPKVLTTPVTYEAGGQEVTLTGKDVVNYLSIRGNNKSLTEKEVVMFLNLCKYQKLNPFLNEAYLVKFGNQAQMIVGKEAFMKRAYRSEDFLRVDAGIIVVRKDEIVYQDGSFKLPDDELVGGWATLHRKGQEPFKMTVSFDEFNTKKSTWREKPALMIRKVAIVNCLREAYPDALGAMYTEDEMGIEREDDNIVEEVVDKEEANSETLDFEEVEFEEVEEEKEEKEEKEEDPQEEIVAEEKKEEKEESQITMGLPDELPTSL